MVNRKIVYFDHATVFGAFTKIAAKKDEQARKAEIVELAIDWRTKLHGKIVAQIPVYGSDHWTPVYTAEERCGGNSIGRSTTKIP